MNAPLWLGRLHPLVVHFPIALLLVAAAVEMAGLFHDHPALGRLVTFLLAVGAVSAMASAATGWGFVGEHHPRPSMHTMLSWHRWLGVTTALLATAAWAVARRAADDARPPARWLRRGLVWLTAGVLTVTGHLGALMVWGEDYFSPNP